MSATEIKSTPQQKQQQEEEILPSWGKRTPNGIKQRLQKKGTSRQADPQLFEDVSYVLSHDQTYSVEERQEVLEIARGKRHLFSEKQWKGLEVKIEVKENSGWDNGCPDGIDQYDYDEYW